MTTEPTLGAAEAAALLDNGAILAPGTAAGDDVDGLTARTYTHPGLGDRRIVRLVPSTVGDAEDLALDFLGLTREGDAPDIGQVRRETLGFPAWALVNDPANGHHALALVRDVERLDRQARSKPGHAKDGFDALGAKLGRAVPHFLPTFYEQAARIFLGHENTTYAATFFGKARDAERVHSLPVEEDRLRAVFLEFAFAGALTAKALKEYAKDLTRRLEPADAWAQFRQLCVERCGAGMPPYAGLAEDARAMIRAVGGGAEAQSAAERALLADLLPSPAVVHAPLSFWKTFGKSLAALAADEPAVRERLLEIFPTPGSGDSADIDGYWLSLLLACGADSTLTTPGALAPGGAAAWLTRWTKHSARSRQGRSRDTVTLDLIERMAPVLRADGVAVDLFGVNYAGVASADRVDLCLAHGVPLVDPNARNCIDLASWFADEGPGRRDLVAAAADPRYNAVLRRATGELGSDANKAHLAATAAHPVLRGVLHDWLDERTDDLTTQSGLPGAQSTLHRILPFRAVSADVNPEAVARVQAFDVAGVLARTLRAGILDELGWPALEEGLRLLGALGDPATPGLDSGEDTVAYNVAEAWPALILYSAAKAVVVGPDGVLLDHDLRIPDKLDRWRKPWFRYVDGELMVMWHTDGENRAYWSSRPAETFEPVGEQVPGRYGSDATITSIPHPDGGRVTGGRILHAGDTALPIRRPVMTDGVGHWVLNWDQHPARWCEYDPATGTRDRASLPAPLAAAVADGGHLITGMSELLPLQPGLADSPFGTDGTLLGRWVRDDGDHVTAGTLDGYTVTLRNPERGYDHQPRQFPVGGLRLPGGARPIIVTNDKSTSIHDGSGQLGNVTQERRGGDHAAGTAYVPELAFWHALRPRDEAASDALRTVTDADAAALLAGSADEYEAAQATADPDAVRPDPVPLGTVAAALPAVAHPSIAAGVAGITRVAARLARGLVAFGTPPAPEAVKDEGYRPQHGEDDVLGNAVDGLAVHRGYRHYGQRNNPWSILNSIRAVAALLTEEHDTPEDTPDDTWTSTRLPAADAMFNWSGAIGRCAPHLLRAASPTTSTQHRVALTLFAEELAADAFQRPGRLRRVILCAEERSYSRIGEVLRRGDRVVVILANDGWGDNRRQHYVALDHDPTGEFGAIDDFGTHDSWLVEHLDDPAHIAELARRIRESGPVTWRPEAVEAFTAATGARRPETALLFAGLPGLNTYGRTFIDTEQRTVLGLKAAEAATARDKLRGLDLELRIRLCTALVPADPDAWWTTGPDAAAAAAEWNAHFGDVVRLPEDIATDAAAARIGDGMLDPVLNPGSSPALSHRTVQRLNDDGHLVAEDPQAVPHGHFLASCVRTLRWLAYRLPYGHPLRPALPTALTALRERLTDPDLLLDLGMAYGERGGYTSVALREAVGLPETTGADGMVRIGDAIVLTPWYEKAEHVMVRVSAITGPDDPELQRVIGLSAAGQSWQAESLRTILGADFAHLLGTGVDGPAGHAQDPSWSVPDLVAEVAKTHELDPDAAALYLQLLALPDPSDRNVARWTGWKPARLKAARAALAATDLVVSAKRSRAGRSLFLPGGWHELKTALPLETWKDALYPVVDGPSLVPDRPVTDLFRYAWQRTQEGDAPGFEQLVTRTARRGRRR